MASMAEKTPVNDYLSDFEVFETLTEQTMKNENAENALAANCMSTDLGKKVLQYLDSRPAKLQTREKLEDFLHLQSRLIGDDKISAAQTIQIINQKIQLRKVLSVLKGFGRYFHVEDKKSIFYSKIWPSVAFPV